MRCLINWIDNNKYHYGDVPQQERVRHLCDGPIEQEETTEDHKLNKS
jgi:hypothetical protein